MIVRLPTGLNFKRFTGFITAPAVRSAEVFRKFLLDSLSVMFNNISFIQLKINYKIKINNPINFIILKYINEANIMPYQVVIEHTGLNFPEIAGRNR